MENKQIELDAFEESILSSLFGENWKSSPSFKMLEVIKPNLVQGYIDRFESLVLPFMNDDGSLNGAMLKKALEIKSPTIAELIPEKNFRLNELSKGLIKILKGE